MDPGIKNSDNNNDGEVIVLPQALLSYKSIIK